MKLLTIFATEHRLGASHLTAIVRGVRTDHFADLSLNQWMALTPPALVKAHLNLDDHAISKLSKHKPILVSQS
jgi:hypothetical protein